MNATRLLPLAIALLLASCTIENTAILTKPTGDLCDVHLRQQRKTLRAELLAVEADAIVVLLNQTLVKIPEQDIRVVSVVGYDNTTEKVMLNGFSSVGFFMAGVLMLTNNEEHPVVNVVPAAILCLGFGVLNMVAVLDKTPRTSFAFPLSLEDRERLRLFSRYQAGLSPERWKDLLAQYKQEAFASAP